MAKLHHVRKARKSNRKLGIVKGLPYYHWRFRKDKQRRVSLTKPPRSAYMTTSPFLRAMMDAEDAFEKLVADRLPPEETRDAATAMADEIESLLTDTAEKLDNVRRAFPNGSPTVELLTRRVECCREIRDMLADAAGRIEDDSTPDDVATALGCVSWEYE